MPIVVDKEMIKNEIIEAFDRLSLERPLTDISLREIAIEAGMSHSKILRYFGNKNSLYEACVHWVAEKQKKSIVLWLELHKYEKDIDKIDYLNQFFEFLCGDEFKAVSPRNIIITCVMGAYNDQIMNIIQTEFENLKNIFIQHLSDIYCLNLTQNEKMAFDIIFYGIYFSDFLGALPVENKVNIATSLKSFLSED